MGRKLQVLVRPSLLLAAMCAAACCVPLTPVITELSSGMDRCRDNPTYAILDNEPFTLSVSVMADPCPEVKWRINGMDLNEVEEEMNMLNVYVTNNCSDFTDNNYTFTITINTVTDSTAGYYTATFSNQAGNITLGPILITPEESVRVLGVGIKNSSCLHEGMNETIFCMVEGYPYPTITFEKGDRFLNNYEELFLDDRVSLNDCGMVVLTPSLQTDIGSYRCTASNIANGKSSNVRDSDSLNICLPPIGPAIAVPLGSVFGVLLLVLGVVCIGCVCRYCICGLCCEICDDCLPRKKVGRWTRIQDDPELPKPPNHRKLVKDSSPEPGASYHPATSKPHEFQSGDSVTVELDLAIFKVMQEGHKDQMAEVPQHSKGDTVRILDDIATVYDLQKGHGGWNDEMALSLGQVGRVVNFLPKGDVSVCVNGQKWIYNPRCMELAPGENPPEATSLDLQPPKRKKPVEESSPKPELPKPLEPQMDCKGPKPGCGFDCKDIVISYSKEDGVNDFIHKLKIDLESAGFSIWMDVTDIPTGSEWPNHIGVALNNCTTVVTVVTKKFAESTFCRNELIIALETEKTVIPLIYEDGWADSVYGLGLRMIISSFNWGWFRPDKDNYDHSLQMLVDGLKGRGERSIATNHRQVTTDAVEDMPDTISRLVCPDTVEHMQDETSRLDQRPKLAELKLLKLPSGENVKVIKSLASKWKEIGISFDFADNGTSLDIIELQHSLSGPIMCCTEMLRSWLNFNGKQPVTWRTLIELLEDNEQGHLAQQLKEAL